MFVQPVVQFNWRGGWKSNRGCLDKKSVPSAALVSEWMKGLWMLESKVLMRVLYGWWVRRRCICSCRWYCIANAIGVFFSNEMAILVNSSYNDACNGVTCTLLIICSLSSNLIGKLGGKAIGDALARNRCLQIMKWVEDWEGGRGEGHESLNDMWRRGCDRVDKCGGFRLHTWETTCHGIYEEGSRRCVGLIEW